MAGEVQENMPVHNQLDVHENERLQLEKGIKQLSKVGSWGRKIVLKNDQIKVEFKFFSPSKEDAEEIISTFKHVFKRVRELDPEGSKFTNEFYSIIGKIQVYLEENPPFQEVLQKQALQRAELKKEKEQSKISSSQAPLVSPKPPLKKNVERDHPQTSSMSMAFTKEVQKGGLYASTDPELEEVFRNLCEKEFTSNVDNVEDREETADFIEFLNDSLKDILIEFQENRNRPLVNELNKKLIEKVKGLEIPEDILENLKASLEHITSDFDFHAKFVASPLWIQHENAQSSPDFTDDRLQQDIQKPRKEGRKSMSDPDYIPTEQPTEAEAEKPTKTEADSNTSKKVDFTTNTTDFIPKKTGMNFDKLSKMDKEELTFDNLSYAFQKFCLKLPKETLWDTMAVFHNTLNEVANGPVDAEKSKIEIFYHKLQVYLRVNLNQATVRDLLSKLMEPTIRKVFENFFEVETEQNLSTESHEEPVISKSEIEEENQRIADGEKIAQKNRRKAEQVEKSQEFENLLEERVLEKRRREGRM